LALSAGDFSYLLEDWAQRMVVKDAFAEATASLHELLGIDVSVHSLEGMNRRMAADVEAFREQQQPPAASDEGELLVVLSDATGVPMHRRGGPLSDFERRQMAYLGRARHCLHLTWLAAEFGQEGSCGVVDRGWLVELV
jgi:hypothetical protein